MHAGKPTGPARNCHIVFSSLILLAGLTGCASFHAQGDPGKGGVLKRTEHVIATMAVGFISSSDGGSVRSAWEDGNGMWHWIRVEPGVGTFRCQGYLLGVPKLCEQISSP